MITMDDKYMLFYLLYNLFADIKLQSTDEDLHSVYVKQATDYICANYNKNIKINDIANRLNIDRTYLYRLFKKEYDLSPQKYLLIFRLKKAAKKLTNTHKPIYEISEECGFSQVSSFCYNFKRFYNDTPLNYRKIFRNVA